MTDYIEREAAVDAINKSLFSYEDRNEEQFMTDPELDLSQWFFHRIFVQNMNGIDKQAILDLPAADVRPVVRGKWLQDCDYHFRCSVCGDRWTVSNGNPLDLSNGWNYCPNCGADMRSGG